MVVSKYKNFLTRNTFELILFIFFIFYFSFWIKFNFSTINLNNTDLNTAIELRNYKPYLSFYLNNILNSSTLNLFLGFCFFPALVAIIIFKIFKKILSSNIWSFSLTFISLTATENFPFINFLVGLFKNLDLKTNVNLYENFEIMGIKNAYVPGILARGFNPDRKTIINAILENSHKIGQSIAKTVLYI